MLGELDVCQCNLVGYINDAAKCYHNVSAAMMGPNLLARGIISPDVVEEEVIVKKEWSGAATAAAGASMEEMVNALTKLRVCTPATPAEQGKGCCDTWPDSKTHNAVAFTCAAVWGGTNRLQRGLNWLAHLRHMYSGSFEPRFAFFNGGHSDKAMGHSEAYREWVFGRGGGVAEALEDVGVFV